MSKNLNALESVLSLFTMKNQSTIKAALAHSKEAHDKDITDFFESMKADNELAKKFRKLIACPGAAVAIGVLLVDRGIEDINMAKGELKIH